MNQPIDMNSVQPEPVAEPDPNIQPEIKPKNNWVITLIIVLFILGAGGYFVMNFFSNKDDVNLGGNVPLESSSDIPSPVFSSLPTNSARPTTSPITTQNRNQQSAYGSPLALTNLKNLSYGIDGTAITLANGFYTNQNSARPFTAKLNEQFIAYNNLDQAKATRAAVVISTRTGGLQTLYYVVLLDIENGQATEMDAQLIDDRPIIQGISFSGDNINVNATIHGDNDQDCCPTQKRTLVYSLEDGLLIQQD